MRAGLALVGLALALLLLVGWLHRETDVEVVVCSKPGVVGDWVSGGVYGCWHNADGTWVSSRAY